MKAAILAALALIQPALASPIRPSPTTTANEAAYTSSMLSSLWEPITVSYANVTTVVEPTAVPTDELIEPPWLPDLGSPYRLPSDFVWGVSGAAFQVEGAVDADGRGPSVWDHASHLVPGFIEDNSTGDVADNHYWLYKQDAVRLKAIGVQTYSLSVSWTRIFPFGNGSVNEAGLQHYIDEVSYLNSLGIEPVVTLFHWDMPQTLQTWYNGIWGEPFSDDFANYARAVFNALAPLGVNRWVSLNEPDWACYGLWPSFVEVLPEDVFSRPDMTTNELIYSCSRNSLLAHGKAAKILKEEIEPQYGPQKITYKSATQYGEPFTNSTEDAKAAERQNTWFQQWFAWPVWKGDWHPLLKETLGDILPAFTEDEITMLKGSCDFYAFDFYNGLYYSAPDSGVDGCAANSSDPHWPICAVASNYAPGGWLVGAGSATNHDFNTPSLFRNALRYIHNTSGAPEIMLTEYGLPVYGESDPGMELAQIRFDIDRTLYYHNYLNEILGAYNEDKIPIKGALAWAITDNLEWTAGESVRFGVQYVNYTTQERHYKQSLFYLSKFFEEHIA